LGIVETAVIAVVAIAIIIGGFAFAFRNGYITIETGEEKNPEEETSKEEKPKPRPYDDKSLYY
jgi:hypothetical protein